MYTETIEALPRLFAWHNGQGFFDAVYASGHDHASERTHRALDRIGTIDLELSHSMRDCLQGLPQHAQARFMTAPETTERASVLLEEKNPARHISFLVNALMAERAVSGEGQKPARPCWTALGDFYFSGGENHAAESSDFHFETNQDFRAPLLEDSVPLDFASPYAKATTPCRSPFQPYEPEQAQAACCALQDAFRRVASIPSPAQLISRFTKVIVLRKDVPTGHSSSSMRNYPGRMLLRNPEKATAGALASSMIHESIHHFLYTIEFDGDFVGLEGPRVPSPWTGRELALHSYLHACFVWYGLAQFWHKQQTMNVFPPEMANAELTRAASGFLKGNPVDHLMPHAHLFRREPLDAASSLHEELRKAGVLDTPAQNVA